MKQNNDLIINKVTGTSSYSSTPAWAGAMIRASVQISISSGSYTGTFFVQASNDLATGLPPGQFVPSNWSTVNSMTAVCSVTAIGSSSTFLIPSTELSYEYLKVIYVDANAGGTAGVASVRLVSKGL